MSLSSFHISSRTRHLLSGHLSCLGILGQPHAFSWYPHRIRSANAVLLCTGRSCYFSSLKGLKHQLPLFWLLYLVLFFFFNLQLDEAAFPANGRLSEPRLQPVTCVERPRPVDGVVKMGPGEWAQCGLFEEHTLFFPPLERNSVLLEIHKTPLDGPPGSCFRS